MRRHTSLASIFAVVAGIPAAQALLIVCIVAIHHHPTYRVLVMAVPVALFVVLLDLRLAHTMLITWRIRRLYRHPNASTLQHDYALLVQALAHQQSLPPISAHDTLNARQRHVVQHHQTHPVPDIHPLPERIWTQAGMLCARQHQLTWWDGLALPDVWDVFLVPPSSAHHRLGLVATVAPRPTRPRRWPFTSPAPIPTHQDRP